MATIHPAAQGTQTIRLWRAGILAALVAAVINTVIYAVGQRLGILSDRVLIPATGQPLMLAPVLLASAIPIIAATALLGLLYRYAPRPLPTFIAIAVAVLVLSGASPFTCLPLMAPIAQRCSSCISSLHSPVGGHSSRSAVDSS